MLSVAAVVRLFCVECTEGSRQLILCLVRLAYYRPPTLMERNHPWQFVGALAAALITGYCTLVAAGKAPAPWEIAADRPLTPPPSEAPPHATSPPPLASAEAQKPHAAATSGIAADRVPDRQLPYVQIADLIPFQYQGRVPPQRQKKMSETYDGKRVRLTGYLVRICECDKSDPEVHFNLAPEPSATEYFNMHMPRSSAGRLLRTPLGTRLTFEATLGVPARGSAAGLDAEIVDYGAE
jgi:hypothetical protein